MTIQLLLLSLLAILAIWIIIEDLRKMEIATWVVIGFAILSIFTGILTPLPDLSANSALWGAMSGLLMGSLTRGYIHWRTGIPAFGGADIALIAGIGGLLGPFLLGPWLFAASLIGIALSLCVGVFRRLIKINDTDLEVQPFCPALLISAAVFYVPALAGQISAVSPF